MSTMSPEARQELVTAVAEQYQQSAAAGEGVDSGLSSSRSPGTIASTPFES